VSARKTYRTSLSRVTGLGSAGEGTGHFIAQRLTALANIPLTLFLVWLVIRLAGTERTEMVSLVANPLVATPLLLLMLSVTWHMRLGAQVVIEDYIHTEWRKVVLLLLNTLFAAAIAGLSIVSVLMLAFGS
jgi:succinate dehydrogenase / fumarate reductase membrane anchor subunit